MTFADQILVDLYNVNRKLGLHPIDRFDTEPGTLPAFDQRLTAVHLSVNTDSDRAVGTYDD